jgi:DnaJ-class molecular chaperone
MALNIIEEKEERALINCAFCGGKGKDPFGIMSYLSTCYACLGRKDVWVLKPLMECVYCRGTGISPIGGRNYCIVCHGWGVTSVKEPTEVCPACKGSGIHKHKTPGLYCINCKGKGVISID